jgi:basic membrane protein A and related proteins
LVNTVRITNLCLLVLAVGAVAACNRRASSPAQAEGTFRAAVVVPGSTADGGWNYSAKEGALLVEKELKLPQPVNFVENVEASKRKTLLRDYGRDGYNLVICHGYEFNQVVKEIAPEFPKTRFIVSGYDQPDPHFGSIVYQLGEAAYLCGAVAAKVTRTGQVGFVAAQPVPPVELCYRGFRNGFVKYRPDGRVREPVYIEGSRPWEDSTAAKVKTQALLSANEPAAIDVLFQNADAASRGIFEAVEEHRGPIFVFGANRDQNDTQATSKVLASAVIHVDQAFVRVAKAVQAGTYSPHVESETVKSGVIECVLNPRLAKMVDEPTAAACRAAIEEARQALAAGKVDPYAK